MVLYRFADATNWTVSQIIPSETTVDSVSLQNGTLLWGESTGTYRPALVFPDFNATVSNVTNAGSASIYQRTSSLVSFELLQQLLLPVPQSGALCGVTVSMDGETAALGCPAYVTGWANDGSGNLVPASGPSDGSGFYGVAEQYHRILSSNYWQWQRELTDFTCERPLTPQANQFVAFGSVVSVSQRAVVVDNPTTRAPSTQVLGEIMYWGNPCDSIPYQNAGLCVASDDLLSYQCVCLAGFSGAQCQADINECASVPCQNAATCVDRINAFTCICAAGFSGVLCQTDINECASQPCTNGGTCTDFINGYSCQCFAGLSGLQCQTDINECNSSPCRNGGTCVDQRNGFVCICVTGFSGVLCDTTIGVLCLSLIAPCVLHTIE